MLCFDTFCRGLVDVYVVEFWVRVVVSVFPDGLALGIVY